MVNILSAARLHHDDLTVERVGSKAGVIRI
jgi:hypothetical protein